MYKDVLPDGVYPVSIDRCSILRLFNLISYPSGYVRCGAASFCRLSGMSADSEPKA
jgi:hypothetical protein